MPLTYVIRPAVPVIPPREEVGSMRVYRPRERMARGEFWVIVGCFMVLVVCLAAASLLLVTMPGGAAGDPGGRVVPSTYGPLPAAPR